MSKKRCAFVAAAVLTVCTVAFLRWNGPSDGAEKSVSAEVPSALAPSAPSAVAAVAPASVQPSSNQTATVRGTKPYVLICARGFNKPMRLAAEALGVRTVSVLSRKSLLVEADAAALSRVAADGRFTVETEFLPSEKLSPALAAKVAGGAGALDVTVITLTPADHRLVQDRVVARGGEILTGCFNEGTTFKARMSAALVSELASCGDVRWMEDFVRPQFMNDIAVNPPAANVRPLWLSAENPGGLSGAGQFVSTSDSGIDTGNLETMHADLKNQICGIKVVDGCYDHDESGHGTHTAGSIVGDGTMSQDNLEAYPNGPIRGTAWGAKLYAWFCGGTDGYVYTPDKKEDLFRPDPAYPTFIHSASWGSKNAPSEYTAESAGVDLYVWEHPDFLPVFSAGNEGSGARTIGSPATAKNVLTVGATQNLRKEGAGRLNNGDPTQTAEYSSRGPCQDGRIKPDIATPGTGVLSTRAHAVDYNVNGYGNYDEFYAYDTGTSMACPLTAGAVAVMREWLMRDCGFTDEEPPTAALMKAIITGGAKDAERPNYDQGWGRLDLAETLMPSNRAVKLIDRIPFADGEEFTWLVETTDEAPLDVQLAWIDFPGAASGTQAAAKIVNDLDLTVRAADSEDVLYGNGGNSADTLNTLESVRIASARPKQYFVTVSCPHIFADWAEGGAAALYIRGAFDPDTVEPYWTARIVKSPSVTNTYSRLDKALNDAVNGDVIEILDSIVLRESVVLTNNYALTITATNANSRLSPIIRRKGADILVRNGLLYFTNVVFQTENTTPVKVLNPGIVKVAGTAVFDDIVSRTPGILTDRPEGFVLAGRLENGITVDCTGKNNPGDQFGVYSCADAVAAESAPRLVSAYAANHSGVAEGSGGAGILKWIDDAPVAPEVAIGYVEGDEPVYYRSLDRIFEDHPNGTNVVLTKSGLSLEKPRKLSGKQSIVAEDGVGEIVIHPASGAGFAIGAGCDLTVSGLAFEDYTGNGLFVVNGTDAKLTVIDSAFRNIEGTNKWSGAVAVRKGALLVRDSVFENCRATGDHLKQMAQTVLPVTGKESFGGAIYLAGTECSLELNGGKITGCSARTYGGGVYANKGSSVSVCGTLTVKGNTAGNYEGKGDDDIHLVNATTSTLTLSDKLDGTDSVGVRYQGSAVAPARGNGLGNSFAAVAPEADYASSLKAFFNDTNPDGMKAVADATGANLLWAERTSGDRNVDPGDVDATIRVTKGGVTQYYIEPEYAFGWIDADATVELLKDAEFGDDLVVTNDVKVTLTSANSGSFVLSRSGPFKVKVLSGASLTVANAVLDGDGEEVSVGLISVDGGSLELQSGVTVRNVVGLADRASGAISIQNYGTFTMRSGAEIVDCENDYVNYGSKAGYGGGLMVEDHSTANLLGGSITGCKANRGGGVFIGTKSTVNISGDMTIFGNSNWSLTDNLCVADLSKLCLVGPFTGKIGYNEGRSGDTNVFGKVTFSGSAADIQTSAHRFTHDFTGDVGMAVTDGSETLLVWGSALDANGMYDSTYALVGGELCKIAVPVASNFIYDGTAKTSLEDGIGYRVVSGNVATGVGNYVAIVTTRAGFAWNDGTTGQKEVAWEIRAATYVLKGVTFEDRTYVYNGRVKTLEISGTLPQGLSVTYTNNIRWQPGTNEVTALIRGSIPNYKPDPFEMTLRAKLIITDPEGRFNGDITQPELTPVEPPVAIAGLVYNGLEQTGVAVAAEGYLLTGNTAVNAGSYTAIAELQWGYKWSDGTTESKRIGWTIAKATHDMSGVSFDDATFTYDGTPKSIFVTGDLPEGVMTNYTGNGKTEVGSYNVTVSFTVDEVNYNAIDSWTRTLTITPKEEPQEYTVTTNTPTPIAFSEITRISDTEWRIVVTDLVEQAEYAVSYTPDLTTAFTTDTWFRATSGGAWTNTVQKTESAYFWRAHGRTTYVTNWIEQSK